MLGSMLTKEEVEEFMREADVVSSGLNYKCHNGKDYFKTRNGFLKYIFNLSKFL